jgi:hypothetical protein
MLARLENRVRDAENRAKTAEAKIDGLKKLVNSSSSEGWPAVRKAGDLIFDAIANLHKLPANTIVPHMRSVDGFPLDSDAIKAEPTAEELESAKCFIQGLTPQVRVRDFVALGMEDSVASMDLEGSREISFSTDFVWGLERLQDENDAKFMCRITLWHMLGHAAWFGFRGNGKDHTPETFKGANSKKLQVMRI